MEEAYALQMMAFEKRFKGKIDYTIGSALDLFGGNLEFEKIVKL